MDYDQYWDYHPGDVVMTVDGYPGTVMEVTGGPVPGNEDYLVELHNGMGGGHYTSGQLTKSINPRVAADQHQAAGLHLASEDYPELGELLYERPDPGKLTFAAARAEVDDYDFRLHEQDTGGTKFPTKHTLNAHNPRTRGVDGSIDYFPPKRRGGPVHIDNVRTDLGYPGVGSALMNEVQNRHPDSPVKFLHEMKRDKNTPSHTNGGHGQPTDWDTWHDAVAYDGIHRGFAARLSPEHASVINNPHASKDEHLAALHEALPPGTRMGMHWTGDERQAHGFAHRNVMDPRTDIPVILHAKGPALKDIETRPDHLFRNGVYPYEHKEREVPIRRGRKVEVTGISWRPDAPHPDADREGWVHHDYAEGESVHHTAAFVGADTTNADDPQPRDTDQPDACSYCGSTDFTGFTDNGRVKQATCATCGGTMSAHPGAQWTPELIGDPSNHPSTTVDPASGASGAGGQAGINDLIDFDSRVSNSASLHTAAADGPDWCTWRVAAQCTFPNDRNNQLLAEPQVRGACPWDTRWQQQVCPISEPGPGAGVSRKALLEGVESGATYTAALEVTAVDDEDDTSYRMQHQAPDADFGAPLHDVTQGERIFPHEFHEHPEWYHSLQPHDWDSVSVIQSARDQPEKMINIYRALPAEHAHKGIRPGDWVSTSKDYARGEGRTTSNPKDDYPVIHARVPAKHLHTEGDVNEWGYNGPDIVHGRVVYKGGHNQEVRHNAQGEIKQVQRRPKKASQEDGAASAMSRIASQMKNALGPNSANRTAGHSYRQTVQTPTGYEDREHEVEGPLYHGGRANLAPGEHLTTGRKPNAWGDDAHKSTHNYFTSDQDTALSYAQQVGRKGRVYEVEPTGEFNRDRSDSDFKTPHPLRVVREVTRDEWPDWAKR